MFSLIEKHYIHNYSRYIKRMQYRVRDLHAAEDIVQEAYYRALRYCSSFIQGTPFDHWFSRILSNTYQQHIDKEKGRLHDEFDEGVCEGVRCEGVGKMLALKVAQYLDCIYEGSDKEIVTLYFSYGYSPKEIQQITNESLIHINNTIARCRASVKEG